MAVSYQPVTEHAANLSDNLCRWDGKSAGHAKPAATTPKPAEPQKPQ